MQDQSGRYTSWESILFKVNDTGKCVRLQAGPADQRAINIGLGQQSIDVVRLDAAAVHNPNRGSALD